MKKNIILIALIVSVSILGSFNKQATSHNEDNALKGNAIQENINDFAVYVGYFWFVDPDNPPLALGKVKVYAKDTRLSDSPILTGKIIGPRENSPIAFQASGYYYNVSLDSGNVSNFDGYVTYGGEQYHIQYTGGINYP